MDIKSLEKYFSEDEYAIEIFNKLIKQIDRIEKEEKKLSEWKKNRLNRIADNGDVLVCATITTIPPILLVILVCYLLKYPITEDVVLILVLLMLIVNLIIWEWQFDKRLKTRPCINYNLINYDELLYLNAFLKEKSIEKVEKFKILTINNCWFGYGKNKGIFKLEDYHLSKGFDKENKNLFLIHYYCIRIQKKGGLRVEEIEEFVQEDLILGKNEC